MQPAPNLESVATAIHEFLRSATQPVLIEPGEEPLPLTTGHFVITPRGNAAMLECWSDTRNLVRRVTGAKSQRRGRLDLTADKFGGRTISLLLVDLAQPATEPVTRRGTRLQYRERFRKSLRRQFPGWRLAELSTDPDLHHSLSPIYPRALLRRGNAGLAAIGASEGCLDPDGALSFGLIWLDHLRKRERKIGIEGLAVLLPAGQERTTCHRVRYLNPLAARYAVIVHGPDGWEDVVDPGSYTNLDTRLEPYKLALHDASAEIHSWVGRLAAIQGVDQRFTPDGSVILSVRGMEFARTSGDSLLFGVDGKHAAGSERHVQEIEQLAHGLARLRTSSSPDRTNPLYTRHPESWLESQVRSAPETLDATIHPTPIYTQAPHLAAGERGIVDLLAVDRSGRLAVIELKASQDIHMPLQALDYWIHVKWHLDRGEFASGGYFPQIALTQQPPRLLLVAPALDFHPSNETVLRYFSREVPAERVGVGLEWRQELRVMFRAPA